MILKPIKQFFTYHTVVIRLLILYLSFMLAFLITTFDYRSRPGVGFFIFNFIYLYLFSYFFPYFMRLTFRARRYKGPYRADLLQMAKDQKIRLKKLYIVKSKMPNAFAVSFGLNRCIGLTTALLDNYTFEDIQAVMAHELGHHKHQDTWKGTIRVITYLLFGSWLSVSIASWLGLQSKVWLWPIGLIIGTLLLALHLRITRINERKADAFAASVLPDPEALAHFFEKVIQFYREQGIHIFNPTPKLIKIFSSHPPVLERIAEITGEAGQSKLHN